MTEFPPNAHKQRQRPTEPVKREDKAPDKKPRVTEKVVTGQVVVRKKSIGRRFRETFLGSDSRSVWSYVVQDILVPAAKDTLSDAVSSGIEHMLFGESRGGRSRRGYSRRGGPEPRVYHNYQRYSVRDERDRPPFQSDRRSSRRRRSERRDLGDIVLATRAEADEVLVRMDELVDRYETVSVTDLLGMLGSTAEYTDDNWGWVDLHDARVRRVTGGYLLDLPDPQPLD